MPSNALAAIAPALLYRDTLSASTSTSTSTLPGPSADSSTSSGASSSSSSCLGVALVLHLTRNQMFLLAAEQWRRCDSYFWLLRQIAQASHEAREVMVHRDVLVQLVDLVLGDRERRAALHQGHSPPRTHQLRVRGG